MRCDTHNNLPRVESALQRAECQLKLTLHVEATQRQALDSRHLRTSREEREHFVHPVRIVDHVSIESDCAVSHVEHSSCSPLLRPHATLADFRKASVVYK